MRTLKIKSIKNKTMPLGSFWEESDHSVRYDGEGLIRKIDPILVQTPDGPKKATSAYKTRGHFRRFTMSNGIEMRFLDNHRFMDPEGEWIYVRDLKKGDQLLGQDGSHQIVSMERETTLEDAYDIQVPGPECYYANGILSHNSLIMNQLALNQASMGYKVNVVPLEMNTNELLSRSIANVSGIDANKIQLRRMATAEKELAAKRWRRLERRIRKNNGRITIFKPQADMRIEEIANALHSLKSDIIYIDYVGLLKGADGDDQWRQLGNIARFAKIHAELTNKCVVLLCQVDQEGIVRYSRAMVEHASTSWIFTATRESREAGYLQIDMTKGRNEQLISFVIKMDYNTQRASDMSPEEMDSVAATKPSSTSSKRGRKGSKGTGSNKNTDQDYLPDITSDSV